MWLSYRCARARAVPSLPPSLPVRAAPPAVPAPSGMANPAGTAVMAIPAMATPTTTVILDAVVVGPAYMS